jgi:hypothetical protein
VRIHAPTNKKTGAFRISAERAGKPTPGLIKD